MTDFVPAITDPITCKESETPLGKCTVTFRETWFEVFFEGEVIQEFAKLTADRTLIAWPSHEQMAKFGLPGKIIVKMDNIPAEAISEIERHAQWSRDLGEKRRAFDRTVNESAEGYNPYG